MRLGVRSVHVTVMASCGQTDIAWLSMKLFTLLQIFSQLVHAQ